MGRSGASERMKISHHCIFGILFLDVLAFGCSSRLSASDAPTIPKDFALSATYGPSMAGFRGAAAWNLIIESDGNAVQKTSTFKGGEEKKVEKSFQVTPEQLRALVLSIEKSGFYSLAPEYRPDVTDLATYILAVTMNGKSHRVLVYAMPAVEDKAAMKRFDSVWNEIRRILGQPPVEWLEKRSLF